MELITSAICMTAVLLGNIDPVDLTGRVYKIKGEANIKHWHNSDNREVLLKEGDAVHEGDEIRTQALSFVSIVLNNQSLVQLAAQTSLTLRKIGKTSETPVRLQVTLGRIWARVVGLLKQETSFEVQSPNAVAGVRGTSFFVDVTKETETTFIVDNGIVQVNDQQGTSLRLMPTQGSFINKNGSASFIKNATGQLRAFKNTFTPDFRLNPNNQALRLERLLRAPKLRGEDKGFRLQKLRQRLYKPRGSALFDPGILRGRVRGRIELVE